MENNISSPSYYTENRQYEPRKVIIDWGLGFYLGNVVKYISRAGRKGKGDDHIDDLLKAKQYLEWEIERVTKAYCSQAMDEAYEDYEKELDVAFKRNDEYYDQYLNEINYGEKYD